MSVSYVDIAGLGTFKTKQDEYNLAHFASLSGGKVTAEQLPSFVDDVIEGYTTVNEGVVTFYSDAEKTQAITGEAGKIYVDLAATIDGSYRYTGSRFTAIGTAVSTVDKAINDANGNAIIETYATKDELSTASTTPATKSSLGVVQIGGNINVDNGSISVNTATDSDLGVVKIGNNIDLDNGTISLKTGSANEKGLLQADMRKDARAGLTSWLATYIDKEIFNKLSTDPTPDRIVYGGSATSKNSIGASDVFNTSLIGKAKRIATADENTMVKPVKINGNDTYAMIIDQWQARELVSDEKWIAAQQHANVRGEKNPIFSGALGVYDGVVLHQICAVDTPCFSCVEETAPLLSTKYVFHFAINSNFLQLIPAVIFVPSSRRISKLPFALRPKINPTLPLHFTLSKSL